MRVVPLATLAQPQRTAPFSEFWGGRPLLQFPDYYSGNFSFLYWNSVSGCMDGIPRQVQCIQFSTRLSMRYINDYNVRILLCRSTFVTIGNVLITMNYAKNFYLYCLVHEDIRKIAVSKLSFLVRKLKLC